MKATIFSVIAAGMVLGAGSAMAEEAVPSILDEIGAQSYASISSDEMATTVGARRTRHYIPRFADATSYADADARGRHGAVTFTDAYSAACTISCGGGGVSATSGSYSSATAY